MLRRKIYRENDNRFLELRSKIGQYSNSVCDITHFNKFCIHNNNTWFNTSIYNIDEKYKGNILPEHIDLSKADDRDFTRKTMQIIMYPNDYQKSIFDKWFDSFARVYNATIIFLRKHLPYGTIKEFKMLYNQNKILNNILKNITRDKNELSKLKLKLDSLYSDLNNLNLIVRKKKNDINKIERIKINITNTGLSIKRLNINIQKLYCSAKPYKCFAKPYETLKIHKYDMLNFQNIRTNDLKTIKESIKEKYSYGIRDEPKTCIPSHSLDGAIKLACSSYKTSIDNFMNNRIKRFRIRCRNLNGKNKLMEIESVYFINGINGFQIKESVLGKMEYTYNGNPYTLTENNTSNIHYDGNVYRLLMPVKIEDSEKSTQSKYVVASLDPGIRVFQTIVTNEGMIKYGINANKMISNYLTKIDKLTDKKTTKNEIIKCKNILENLKKKLTKVQKKLLTASEKNKEYCNITINKLLESIYYYEQKILQLMNEPNKIEKNTIEIEIERCKNTIKIHEENYKLYAENINDEIGEIFRKYIQRMKKLLKCIKFNEQRIEKLTKINENPKKKEKYEKYMRYRKENKSKKYYEIINRKVKEMHWKIARELGSNYETIIIGKLSIHSIVQQDNLDSMTKRVGQLMNHYKFRERLVYKCRTLGSEVIVREESYTTKTCPKCGHFNDWIKAEKFIECESCKKKYDRDGGGATNILIKSLK